MSQRLGDKREMPDVPKFDFVDALSEIWFQISFAAYHMAYVRVYSQSEALRVWPQTLREQDQGIRDHAQIDIVICRSHLAAFFWHVEHVFEALKTAITRCQKELPSEKYFWAYEKRLNELEELPVRQEIKDYRNMAHQTPAIIGCKWDEKRNFLQHFLPTISGHTPQEDVELNLRLQQYFEFAANVWLEFAPRDFKEKFSRDFRFPVTVPLLFTGDLPEELKGKPQLEVQINSYDKSVTGAEPASEGTSGSNRLVPDDKGN